MTKFFNSKSKHDINQNGFCIKADVDYKLFKKNTLKNKIRGTIQKKIFFKGVKKPDDISCVKCVTDNHEKGYGYDKIFKHNFIGMINNFNDGRFDVEVDEDLSSSGGGKSLTIKEIKGLIKGIKTKRDKRRVGNIIIELIKKRKYSINTMNDLVNMMEKM